MKFEDMPANFSVSSWRVMGNPLGNSAEFFNLADFGDWHSYTYGFLTPKKVWVMVTKSPSGDRKMYGLLESMGYRAYGLSGSRL